MTSTSRDDLRAFYQAAFKPIMEEVGKAPSSETMNPSIPMSPFGAYDMMASGMGGMSLHREVKAQPPKPIVPLPSIEPSIVMPLIFELKVKLAKLEEELYRTNGCQMKQSLEVLLVRLDSSDLDHVIEALETLNHILSKELIYSYEPYLIGSIDRIVLLCAKQYRFFFTDYLKIVDLKNPEQVNRIQKFLDENTKVLNSLLVVDRLKFSSGVSRKALHELILSIVPYFVLLKPETGIQQLFHGIHFHNINYLVRDLLDGYNNQAANDHDANVVNPTRLIVAAVVLRLLRDFMLDSNAAKDMMTKQQANLSIDALTSLVKAIFLDFYPGEVNETKHLNAVLYEIYSIFELASDMKTSPLDNNLQVLEKLKSYVCSIFTGLGSEAAWAHFEMLDMELTVAGRDLREVALFKFLAGRGYTRPRAQSKVVKDTDYSSRQVSTDVQY